MLVRITDIAVECEGFVATTEGIPVNPKTIAQSLNGKLAPHGSLSADAGFGLYEIITIPRPSLEDAVDSISVIQQGLHGYVTKRVPFRPDQWQGHGDWASDDRYDAMKLAAAEEVGIENAAAMNKMTNAAAVHLNFSGRFNPIHEDGLFVYNYWNHAAPFYAHKVHSQTGLGGGHLSLWRDFADSRRFTTWNQWFPTHEAFKSFFEGIPRLFAQKNGHWTPLPGECQTLGNRLDHGVFWHFVRPKINEKGEWYMELRFLPSMPDEQIISFGNPVLRTTELLLEWFHGNGGKPVMSVEESAPAFSYVHSIYPDLLPDKPLERKEWETLLYR